MRNLIHRHNRPNRLRAAFWVCIAFVSLPLAGCPDPEECSACDQIYCSGDQVVTCNCDSIPSRQVVDDCTVTESTCAVVVQGKGSGSQTAGYVQGQAACVFAQ